MSLEDKVRFTQRRIEEWVDEFTVDGCYVSFSGGKDMLMTVYPKQKILLKSISVEHYIWKTTVIKGIQKKNLDIERYVVKAIMKE